ncbi:MAG: DNA mismatch repair protein MutS [bacterium JZ-2024 1]
MKPGFSDAPIVRQYRQMKRDYPGFILMFRLGDFYEMFEEDARKAADILGITLTSREWQRGRRVPMCGVPYHSASRYIERLLKSGVRIAICEQMEDPRKARGIVRREVVEVLTPGSVLREEFLDQTRRNYTCAVYFGDTTTGIAFLDISSGDFRVTDFENDVQLFPVIDEIRGKEPAEILAGGNPLLVTALKSKGVQTVDLVPRTLPEYEGFLRDQFGVSTLAGFGLNEHPEAICAAGAILEYFRQLKVSQLRHIERVQFYRREDRMALDWATQRNLELFGSASGDPYSLFHVLNHSVTPMGARFLRDQMASPLCNQGEIEERLDAVSELLERADCRSDLRDTLKQVGDLERILARMGAGRIRTHDLFRIRNALRAVHRLIPIVQQLRSPLFIRLARELIPLHSVQATLDRALVESPAETHFIRDGYDEELDRARTLAEHSESVIKELEAREREETGIKTLRISYNRVLGYYIEVSRGQAQKMPPRYERRQSLTNSERFVSPELKDLENRILSAKEKTEARERELGEGLIAWVTESLDTLKRWVKSLRVIDFLQALSEAAEIHGYSRPEITEADTLVIVEGRHPVVEAELPWGKFVPNSITMDHRARRLGIITGPNMGGKSTFIRQTALIVLMAQMGSFVPAKSARIGIADAIFTRAGAEDRISRGLSTFMVEMTETARILQGASRKSLIILDEIGRGTSTYDGISIAWATTEYIARFIKGRTLFATHFHELTDLEGKMEGVFNLTVQVDESGGTPVFLYRVVPGRAARSYGIEVARWAGIPRWVLIRAREILSQLETRNAVSPSAATPSPKARPPGLFDD